MRNFSGFLSSRHFCGLRQKNLHQFLAANSFSTGSPRYVDISGIFPPITTPFDTNGNISFEHLKRNFDSWNSIPFKGYVVMGSNGEFVSFEKEEKLKLLRNVRELSQVPGKTKTIIAGLGMQGTEQTIELCKRAADDKSADAALIITPSFYKGRMTDSALRIHYEVIADLSPLPIILYSVPANTNLDLDAETVIKLADHPNIIGLKDSGGDITKLARIVYETKNKSFEVLAGSAGFLLPALLMGCTGGICALANVLGNEVCELYKLYQTNRIEEAISLQQRLILPNLLVTRKLGVAGLKAAMDRRGLYGGPCRLPLTPITTSEMEELERGFTKENYPLQS